MGAHHKPRLGQPAPIHGILPGGTRHLILLALRGTGGMDSEQVYARFGGAASNALTDLKRAGLVDLPEHGQKGKPVRLTDKARQLTAHNGPLSRRATLITYCQL